MPTPELTLDIHAELAEGPVWLDTTGELLWVDIEPGDVHWFDPSTGTDRLQHVGEPVGAAVPDQRGGVVLALPRRIVRLAAGSHEPELLVALPGDPDMRMNDAGCDRRGRLWAGSCPADESSPRGKLYRIDADLQATDVLDGITVSNGLDWSPDNSRMYYIDSPTRRVDVLDYDIETGAASNRRPFFTLTDDLPGMPDGMCVDAQGGLWVAVWGGSCVLGLTPDGELHAKLEVPTNQVTSVAFGGPDLRTLYITSAAIDLDAATLAAEPHAGGIFTVDVGVAGLPSVPFAG
jgi:sugar lactone lactonase YvrE